jgi:hypothetical protein
MVNLRTNWLSEQERKHSHLVCGRTTSHKYFGVVFILDMENKDKKDFVSLYIYNIKIDTLFRIHIIVKNKNILYITQILN